MKNKNAVKESVKVRRGDKDCKYSQGENAVINIT